MSKSPHETVRSDATNAVVPGIGHINAAVMPNGNIARRTKSRQRSRLVLNANAGVSQACEPIDDAIWQDVINAVVLSSGDVNAAVSADGYIIGMIQFRVLCQLSAKHRGTRGARSRDGRDDAIRSNAADAIIVSVGDVYASIGCRCDAGRRVEDCSHCRYTITGVSGFTGSRYGRNNVIDTNLLRVLSLPRPKPQYPGGSIISVVNVETPFTHRLCSQAIPGQLHGPSALRRDRGSAALSNDLGSAARAGRGAGESEALLKIRAGGVIHNVVAIQQRNRRLTRASHGTAVGIEAIPFEAVGLIRGCRKRLGEGAPGDVNGKLDALETGRDASAGQGDVDDLVRFIP